MRISGQPSPVQIMIDQKLENSEYVNYLGSMVTYAARCTCEIKAIIVMAKTTFHEMKILCTSNFELNLRKKLVEYYVWGMDLCRAETWTLPIVDQKYLESFEIWYRKRIGEMNRTEYVEYQEVLQRIKDERNILHTIQRKKAKWLGHNLRRNCRQKHVIEIKLEGAGR